MKIAARFIAYLSLLVLTIPPVMFLVGRLTIEQTKLWMLIATVLWFISAPWFMWKDQK